MIGFEWKGWARPGTTLMGDGNAWIACGKPLQDVQAMYPNHPWWNWGRPPIIGALCHEIVHMLVNSPHTSIPGDVLSAACYSWPDVYVQEDVKAAILASGIL